MGIFPNSSPDVATQFWIASGYMEAISVLIAPFFIENRFSRPIVLGIYTLVTVFLVAAVMWFGIFPHCYLEGVGLTSVKVYSEYIISLVMFLGITHLYQKRRRINGTLYRISMAAMIIAIISHVVFTLYIDVYGIINFLGHFCVIIANYLFLSGVIVYGLEKPYDLIFSELKQSAITDQLTGLYNRNGFYELSEQKKARANREGSSFALLMIDIDKFKKINDRFGHLAGDRTLCNFARIIGDATAGIGNACRLGGDEFVILLDDISSLSSLQNKLRQEIRGWKSYDYVVKDIGISIGSAIWEPGSSKSVFELLAEADREMYAEKKAKSANI
jgi:diguanylate cyclase (GGDEF)-like protein